MRKLTPFDDVTCICKDPVRITQTDTGSQTTQAGLNCQCLAYPSQGLAGIKTHAQYQASIRARKLKGTKFKIHSLMPANTKVMMIVKVPGVK